MRIDVGTNEEKDSQLSGLRLMNDRIPVHQGEVLLGYATFRLDGHLELVPEPPPVGFARAAGLIRYHLQNADIGEADRAELAAFTDTLEAGIEGSKLPAPPFGGHSAYERILEALGSVDYCDPTRLEVAAASVHEAVFGARERADELLTRIELPWPRDPEQFEELLMRIPLWSIVAHLVRDRDTEAQCREYQGMMFLPDDQLPPLLDHLDRTLRDSRELWRVCVEQERKLAAVERVLEFEKGQRMIPAATIRAALGQVAADDLD